MSGLEDTKMFRRRRFSGGFRARGRSSRGRRGYSHGARQYGTRTGRSTRRRYYYGGRRY